MIKILIRKLSIQILNFIPNIYFLKSFRNAILKFANVKLSSKNILILSPFYKDSSLHLIIGSNVFINKLTYLEGRGKIIIGNDVQIGPRTLITTSSHDIKDNMKLITKDVKINDNVWVGANVTINPGVEIGPNVIIASGSVVTKKFTNCVVGGVPAKFIKEI